MKPTAARLFEMLWYLFMGLFLGITGGLVLAVILTFRRTREMQASPGVEPFSNPMFADHHHDAVAGAIGQDLFMVGGKAALGLLGLALAARAIHARFVWRSMRMAWRPQVHVVGHRFADRVQSFGVTVCVIGMFLAASDTTSMNHRWPDLYDTRAEPSELDERREQFDPMHQSSERSATVAWLGGLLAFTVSPWCRRPADAPLQSGDGEEKND